MSSGVTEAIEIPFIGSAYKASVMKSLHKWVRVLLGFGSVSLFDFIVWPGCK